MMQVVMLSKVSRTVPTKSRRWPSPHSTRAYVPIKLNLTSAGKLPAGGGGATDRAGALPPGSLSTRRYTPHGGGGSSGGGGGGGLSAGGGEATAEAGNTHGVRIRGRLQLRRRDDFSAREGELLLLEYSEQHPPLLPFGGMASTIVTYTRGASGGVKVDEGIVEALGPGERYPLLGTLGEGERVTALTNRLFSAPLFRHDPLPTDFLLVLRSEKVKEGGAHGGAQPPAHAQAALLGGGVTPKAAATALGGLTPVGGGIAAGPGAGIAGQRDRAAVERGRGRRPLVELWGAARDHRADHRAGPVGEQGPLDHALDAVQAGGQRAQRAGRRAREALVHERDHVVGDHLARAGEGPHHLAPQPRAIRLHRRRALAGQELEQQRADRHRHRLVRARARDRRAIH
jgi:hypothetical protein